jgi:hypothetical protein
MKNYSIRVCVWALSMAAAIGAQEYSTCNTWPEVLEGKNIRYAPLIRVSDPGTSDRPVYHVSPDGTVALTHDFQRMKHGGTAYGGIPDRLAGQRAPAESGIEKMDLNTGQVQFLISHKRMAEIAFPQGYTNNSDLYFFREGWNPSGTRFIAFLKNSSTAKQTNANSIRMKAMDFSSTLLLQRPHWPSSAVG